jgi:Flp pilus assembly protein CpaB
MMYFVNYKETKHVLVFKLKLEYGHRIDSKLCRVHPWPSTHH